ncbi:MAG: hypothetical protein K8S00_06060 [Bacteroidales bacterium]|nr:hypothetical protein [Bacteroidales bacterium]
MNKYTGDIIMGDVFAAVKEIANDVHILNTPLKILTRRLLDFFIDKDCITISFEELREAYKQRIGSDDTEFFQVPKNEEAFYVEICKMYFNLEKTPDSELKDSVNQIIEDLKSINQKKSKYQNKLSLLKKKEFEEGDNYNEKLLIHYINKLQGAEDDILTYIRNNLRIKTNLNKYRTFYTYKFIPDYTYHYNFAPVVYKIDNLSDIRNKFENIAFSKYLKLEKLFRKNKNDFLVELKKKFEITPTISEIKNLIKNNHRLIQRKEILFEVFDLFIKGSYQLFCNVVPQQIEGIIYDYCLEFGIEEKSLINSSIVEKVNLLKENENNEIDYEYFAFRFPIIRNHVTHGNLIQEDIELHSWLLLLDLKYVCELMKSNLLKVNQYNRLINNAKKSKDLISLIQLAPIINEGVDDFYNQSKEDLLEMKEELRNKLIDSTFPYDKINDENNKEIKRCIIILKRVGINEQECIEILKRI